MHGVGDPAWKGWGSQAHASSQDLVKRPFTESETLHRGGGAPRTSRQKRTLHGLPGPVWRGWDFQAAMKVHGAPRHLHGEGGGSAHVAPTGCQAQPGFIQAECSVASYHNG